MSDIKVNVDQRLAALNGMISGTELAGPDEGYYVTLLDNLHRRISPFVPTTFSPAIDHETIGPSAVCSGREIPVGEGATVAKIAVTKSTGEAAPIHFLHEFSSPVEYPNGGVVKYNTIRIRLLGDSIDNISIEAPGDGYTIPEVQ